MKIQTLYLMHQKLYFKDVRINFGSVCLLDDALEQIAQYNVNLWLKQFQEEV